MFLIGLDKYAFKCALKSELDWKAQEHKQSMCCTHLRWCLSNLEVVRLTVYVCV